MNNFEKCINEVQKLLDNKNISGYRISKETGISYQTVQDLNTGKTSLESARIKTVKALYKYATKVNK